MENAWSLAAAFIGVIIIGLVIVKILPFMEYVFTGAGLAVVAVIVIALSAYNIAAGLALIGTGFSSIIRRYWG